MDFVKSYFGKNEPLTSWTRLSPVFFQISTDLGKNGGQKCSTGQRFADLEKKQGKKVFNWSEVHFYRSNFLQNPYFSQTIRKTSGLAISELVVVYGEQSVKIIFTHSLCYSWIILHIFNCYFCQGQRLMKKKCHSTRNIQLQAIKLRAELLIYSNLRIKGNQCTNMLRKQLKNL